MPKLKEEISRKVIGRELKRVQPLRREDVRLDRENRTVELAFLSDQPIEHWFGRLILDHSAGCADYTRLQTNGPLLLEHDRDRKIGGHLKVWSDGHVSRALVKFSRRDAAVAEMDDIEDGIGRGVSGGFIVHEMILEEDGDDGPVYRATKWEPVENSLVSIPADITVGIGRALDPELRREADDADEETDEETDEERTDAECRCELHDDHGDCDSDCDCDEGEETTGRAAAAASVNSQPTVTVVRSSMDKDQEILRLGEMLGEVELARDFIASNKTPDEFKAAVRQRRLTQQAPTPKPPVELSEREREQYSITRAILADANIRDGKRESCFELEVSAEIERNMHSGIKRHGGIFVPTMLKRSGLDTKSTAAGGAAVFTAYEGFLPLLRNKTQVILLGATVLPGLTSNVSFVRQATAGTAFWVGENPGADVTESALSLDLVTLSPKTLQATTSFSRQLLVQASVDVESTVNSDLAEVNAIEIDRAALHGSGAGNEPKGIYNQTGVGVVAFGGQISYDKAVDLETAITAANADIGAMAYLTTPNVRGRAKKTLEFPAVNGAAKLWDKDEMNGYRAVASNNVAKNLGAGTNEHGIVFGVWPVLMIGEFGAMELVTDPYAKKKQGMIEVTSFLMLDVQPKYGPAFAKGTGLLP
ncbi:MAG TPA: phage major capsid protein [Blastocatellia bacterium]|nr:phage major capsid protein [Blastocatellia bacterium]